jgi:hypothetical protein
VVLAVAVQVLGLVLVVHERRDGPLRVHAGVEAGEHGVAVFVAHEAGAHLRPAGDARVVGRAEDHAVAGHLSAIDGPPSSLKQDGSATE